MAALLLQSLRMKEALYGNIAALIVRRGLTTLNDGLLL